MPCRRKKEFQRHTRHVRRSYGRLPLPCKKRKNKTEKREKRKTEKKDQIQKATKEKANKEGKYRQKEKDGKKRTGRREGKDNKPLAKNPPRGKAGRSQCRTAKTTTGEQQQTGKREKTGKKANRTARKATKATMDEGKFRFCHSPLAALPQAAIFFALRV